LFDLKFEVINLLLCTDLCSIEEEKKVFGKEGGTSSKIQNRCRFISLFCTWL